MNRWEGSFVVGTAKLAVRMGSQKFVTASSPTRPIRPPRMVIIAFFDGFLPRYMEKFRP